MKKYKKRIGIVTIMDYANLGNRLQNFAVSYYLKKNFSCTVRVLAPTKDLPYKNGNIIAWIKEKVIFFLCRFPSIVEKRYGSDTIRWVKCIRWSKRHIPIKNIYNHFVIPKSIDDEFDFFVVGSDQVWNYSFAADRFDDYFLKFASPEKRIAFSASIGVETLDSKWENVFRENLESFNKISVREESARNIINRLLLKEVPVFIDPVMLLSVNEWNKVSINPKVRIKRPYILTYFLGDQTLNGSKIEIWAKENSYSIYNILDEKSVLYATGPGEFLSLIANAKLVCTDSFHCTAFSIIYSIPFITYARMGMTCDMSSRLKTLLKLFNFENRWNTLIQEKDYINCDFSHVQAILNRERQRIFNYFKDIIQ